jgi:hypothetical protein
MKIIFALATEKLRICLDKEARSIIDFLLKDNLTADNL